MKHFIVSLILTAIAVFLVASLLPGVSLDGFLTAIIVALALALLNALVKPILVVLTIPITIVTLGLFLLVINTVIVLLAAWMVESFRVDGFWWALVFSLLLSLVNAVLGSLVKG